MRADELQVKELNRGPTGFFVFAPELVRIKPGDTIDDKIDPSGLPPKAKAKIQTLLDQIRNK